MRVSEEEGQKSKRVGCERREERGREGREVDLSRRLTLDLFDEGRSEGERQFSTSK